MAHARPLNLGASQLANVDDSMTTIGELARSAGVPTSTVRHYERRAESQSAKTGISDWFPFNALEDTQYFVSTRGSAMRVGKMASAWCGNGD